MTTPALRTVLAHLKGLAARAAAVATAPPATQLTVLRALLEEYASVDPSAQEVVAEVQPVEVVGRPAEWLRAETSRSDRRLLYLHGGSWMKGSLHSHRALAARIARGAACTVLTLDYRLAPEHPFPAGLEDCAAALKWLGDHGPSGAGAARHLFVAGDSAGGNLTLATLLLARQRDQRQPEGAIAFSPVVDFSGGSPSIRTRAKIDPILTSQTLPRCAAVYLQHGEDPRTPLASPLFGDLNGLPPVLLQVGTAEILLDDARRFAEAARAAGVDVTLEVWPHMPHVFQMFAPFLPEASEALAHVAAFVDRCCHVASGRRPPRLL